MRWLDSITDSMHMNLSKLGGESEGQGSPGVLQSIGFQRFGHDLTTIKHTSEIIYKQK